MNMNIGRLQSIAERASVLSRHEAEELYMVIKDQTHTANQNGVFVNLSLLGEDMIDQIEKFLTFAEEKRNELDNYDRMRESLRVVSAMVPQAAPVLTREVAFESNGSRAAVVMSAMRRESLKFQLLKKRYMKPQDPEGFANPVLVVEQY